MDVALGLIFLGIEVVLIALSGLAIIRTGFIRLDSWIGIAQDGPQLGKSAPHWTLPDIMGDMHQAPAETHWQFLIFTDRSLVGLPELAEGIRDFVRQTAGVEVLLLSRDTPQLCRVTVEVLELPTRIIPVDQAFYDRFRVRVMPFACVVNPHGIVRWRGLLNTGPQLFHMWRMGQAMDADANVR